MSLTGNLDVFPLEEVLRLLARSRKTGCLRVDGLGFQGRVFMANGALTLAMTTSDEDFRRQLVASGLVAAGDLRQVEAGSATLAEVASPSVTDFIREQVVESLYRIRKPGTGAFDFVVDLLPRYPTGQSFDVEVGIAEADRRANEWAEIEAVLPDLDLPYRMVPEIPENEEVTLAAPAWKILAGLGGGATVRQIAAALGSTEFRAARDLAELVRRRLVEPVMAAVAEPAPEPMAKPAPEPMAEKSDQSWFSVAESESAPPAETEPAPVAAAQPADTAPATEATETTGGWWEAQEEPASTVEQGSESDRFLESVFSQLDPDDEAAEAEEGDTEGGFNMGLLRRRRMGAALRDTEDS